MSRFTSKKDSKYLCTVKDCEYSSSSKKKFYKHSVIYHCKVTQQVNWRKESGCGFIAEDKNNLVCHSGNNELLLQDYNSFTEQNKKKLDDVILSFLGEINKTKVPEPKYVQIEKVSEPKYEPKDDPTLEASQIVWEDFVNLGYITEFSTFFEENTTLV